MTKIHFIAIAARLKYLSTLEVTDEWTHRQICIELAKEFTEINERFDAHRFLDACGVKNEYQHAP